MLAGYRLLCEGRQPAQVVVLLVREAVRRSFREERRRILAHLDAPIYHANKHWLVRLVLSACQQQLFTQTETVTTTT